MQKVISTLVVAIASFFVASAVMAAKPKPVYPSTINFSCPDAGALVYKQVDKNKCRQGVSVCYRVSASVENGTLVGYSGMVLTKFDNLTTYQGFPQCSYKALAVAVSRSLQFSPVGSNQGENPYLCKVTGMNKVVCNWNPDPQ